MINGKSEQQLLTNVDIVASVGEIVYLRLANIGFYGTRFIFPAELNATAVSSDGRPLPSPFISDTIELLPGERYGVLIESAIEFQDIVSIEYFDLNTGIVTNTQEAIVDINGFVGIEDNEIYASELIIYPNPAKNELNLSLPQDYLGEIDIQILNMLGQLVFEQNNAPKTINIESLNDGAYIIKVIHQNEQLNKKLIIKR